MGGVRYIDHDGSTFWQTDVHCGRCGKDAPRMPDVCPGRCGCGLCQTCKTFFAPAVLRRRDFRCVCHPDDAQCRQDPA